MRQAYAAGFEPADVVHEVLARITAHGDPAVWIDVEGIEGLELAAKDLGERDRDTSPLWGVPFGVKDNIDVQGRPTTAGLPGAVRTADRTATVVQRLIDAGGIYVGKTNLDQLATGLVGTRSPYGTPRNPFDAALVPGGSSSGSAVAVAAGQVTFALGTDTAGSGRVPAALCGIVGVKGPPGARPMDGVVPASPTLDCVSTFARSIADGLLVESVMAASAWPVAIGPWRVAVADPDGPEGLRLRVGGHEVLAADLAPFHEAGDLLYQGPWLADRTAALADVLAHGLEGTVEIVRRVVAEGARYSGTEVFAAVRRLAEIQTVLAPWWRRVDALVVPTVPWAPTLAAVSVDPIGVNARLGRNTTFANLLGLAAIAVPAADGPGGVTVLGPPGHLGTVAGVAAALHGEALTAGAGGPSGRIHLAVAPDIADGAGVVGAPSSVRGLGSIGGVLAGLGAELVDRTSTAPGYRRARDDAGAGLIGGRALGQGALAHAERTGPAMGIGVGVELWSIAPAGLGRLTASLPTDLALGAVELADGRWVKAVVNDEASRP
ncbi:MAG: Glutamyl-tRNA(Gln) amidotransferase subunit [Acidimicrobiales bacterium]|nr:Glutamyl-tRNA(Gln) amidotransferase subunit [Acidimicrobiales bacterium]